MNNKKEIETLAKKLWSENEDVATELANIIFGIRDGDYDEPEFEYPIYKKSISDGSIVMFTSLTTREVIVQRPRSFTAGTVISNSVPHTSTHTWKDVPYDEERNLYHGQPIYAWDNDTHMKEIRFYNAINRCSFGYTGRLDGANFTNYEAIPTEHIPEWMYEAYKTLEGI